MIETAQMGAFKCCISTAQGRGGSDAVLFLAVEVSDSMTHCGKVTGRVLKKGRVKKKSNWGSFQTWAVFKPGQLSHWGSCHPGAVVYLGSCPTWAVVQPGQLSYLGSCLPGQLSPGQLSAWAVVAWAVVGASLSYLCERTEYKNVSK